MTAADRLIRLTNHLVGDIGRLPGVNLDSAGEQQLVQLITDAMEEVGRVAIDEYEVVNHPTPDLLTPNLASMED